MWCYILKFKGIKIEEIGLEISEYKEEINGEEAYDYFYEILKNKLNGNAYLDEVTDSAIQIRFEREANKETLDYIIDFYNKYIKNNKKILDNCNVKLTISLEEYLGDYNFYDFTIIDFEKNIIKTICFE
ncbi:hypothetical protein HMPREF1092_03220 [Clostridium thermobutyricum]|uniref:Uncharacterized protein n=1 Tax=Clostridium thermobutyricum TaxID=29372 RepID=N9W9A4_9CLOT|nr:hypothetical protein HMPREF1092_03220 [Clostridium thermobutyricum]